MIKVVNDYNNKHNKDPDMNYVSKILNLDRIRLEKIMNLYKNPLSINNISENNEFSFEEFLKNEKNFDFDDKIFNDDLSSYVEELTYKLNNNKFSNILSMRYGFNFSRRYSLAEVGSMYNLSRERIRQIQKEVLLKIKKISDLEKLKNFFKSKYKYY